MSVLEQIFYSLGVAVFSLQLIIFAAIILITGVTYWKLRQWQKRAKRMIPMLLAAKWIGFIVAQLKKKR